MHHVAKEVKKCGRVAWTVKYWKRTMPPCFVDHVALELSLHRHGLQTEKAWHGWELSGYQPDKIVRTQMWI